MTRGKALVALTAVIVGLACSGIVGFGSIISGFDYLGKPTLWAAVDPEYMLVATKEATIGWSGDVDLFEVSLYAGRSYRITMSVPAWADFDIRVYDENENLVATGVEGQGETERVYITPAWTGPFYLRANSYDGDTGGYTIRLWRKI